MVLVKHPGDCNTSTQEHWTNRLRGRLARRATARGNLEGPVVTHCGRRFDRTPLWLAPCLFEPRPNRQVRLAPHALAFLAECLDQLGQDARFRKKGPFRGPGGALGLQGDGAVARTIHAHPSRVVISAAWHELRVPRPFEIPLRSFRDGSHRRCPREAPNRRAAKMGRCSRTARQITRCARCRHSLGGPARPPPPRRPATQHAQKLTKARGFDRGRTSGRTSRTLHRTMHPRKARPGPITDVPIRR